MGKIFENVSKYYSTSEYSQVTDPFAVPLELVLNFGFILFTGFSFPTL